MYELIVCEKPQAANKIAEALCDGKPVKENIGGVPYYKITHGKKDIVVACAVGHLYGLEQEKGEKWGYPIFDVTWQPSHENRKDSAFTKKYLTALKKLAKDANEFTIATDYDIEGEVIGLNIVRYVFKKKDASRMKFSTLTKDDLRDAYKDKTGSIDWGQAKAGETRHFLDWYNGINYSRALTSAIKSTGAFKIMSIGRVQGPALKILTEKEKEIRNFKPVPYWEISILCATKEKDMEAWHTNDKFWKEDDAKKVFDNVKDKKSGVVHSIESSAFEQMPPVPFDLTTLQTETYRCHGISPSSTLEMAQELYTSGCISYPRTSSQQYPESIGYTKIIKMISANSKYSEPAKKILSMKKISPNNGKKTDPAHPAIYPTGIEPGSMDERQEKIYDLIVRRFLATFGEAAIRETVKITIEAGNEMFLAKGTRTTKKGWHEFYGEYVKLEEEEMPKVTKGDALQIKKTTKYDKETQPPKRYTPASIIRELEKRNLGTKATRSTIIDTLFQRGYAHGKAIEATELGIRTCDTLERYSPKIIDDELTRHFEEEMEDIRNNKKTEKGVLDEAKEAIAGILMDFKKKEKEIGKELQSANRETMDAMTTLGKCPNCKEGMLQIRKGKFGHFAACNGYPDCKTTFSLPGNARIKPAGKICDSCGMPLIMILKREKRPQEICMNKDCKTKNLQEESELPKEIQAKIGTECPKCRKGKIALRSSVYGQFLGCDQYPKCKHTEQIQQSKDASR